MSNFASCFISYSTKDRAFVEKLYSGLQSNGVQAFFAEKDLQGGKKLKDQIDRQIKVRDRLLVILSENSLNSEWVMSEIREARKLELYEGVRKLFPISITDFDTIKKWRCFDPDSGKDLAIETREYFIPDFSDWKNQTVFQSTFGKLLEALEKHEPPAPPTNLRRVG